MVKFYVKKIKDMAINPKTGLPWTIDDVPTLWRAAVEEELNK